MLAWGCVAVYNGVTTSGWSLTEEFVFELYDFHLLVILVVSLQQVEKQTSNQEVDDVDPYQNENHLPLHVQALVSEVQNGDVIDE